MINVSAKITKKFPSEASVAGNTAGVVSLVTLQSLAGLISKHINPIPTTIFSLFQSINKSRKETHQLFLEITASNPDPAYHLVSYFVLSFNKKH
jgi:hypothetical protein